MGLLTDGIALNWEDTKQLSKHIRYHGIEQFINLFKKYRYRRNDEFKWGDEIEYALLKFDDDQRKVRVSLRSHEILNTLDNLQLKINSIWQPEYGAFMLEGTPAMPYGHTIHELGTIERKMIERRMDIVGLLHNNEQLMTLTTFPRLGTPQFTEPEYTPKPNDRESIAKSQYIPDELIFQSHPRFLALTRNGLCRRNSPHDMNVKIFIDEHTQIPVIDSPVDRPDTIHMDALAFGGCSCCLQITFQASDINEARTLYDQLLPITPVMLALTAASPIFRGYLTDVDSRWDLLTASLDSRTSEERNLKLINEDQLRIRKSRCDTVHAYLSENGESYNDVSFDYDKEIYSRLRSANVDHLLAQHIAYLFIRDPLVILKDNIFVKDWETTLHFESIQSTNWQTLRFKPPPSLNSDIGWRVEFRPCELQFTDFENAAIVCFMVLLTRTLLSYNTNFLIPISKVDDNMKKAQRRNACLTERFWFRYDTFPNRQNHNTSINNIYECIMRNNANDQYQPHQHQHQYQNTIEKSHENNYKLMTINEIINGIDDDFPGLIPLVRKYLNTMDVDVQTYSTIDKYLNFIKRKASGELLTTASWIRKYVINHPEYLKDSIVTDTINYDLLTMAKELQEGKRTSPDLF